MAAAGGGLIVGVTDGIIDGLPPEQYQGQLMWDLGHHCINRMMLGMAAEGKPHRIAVVTLMPSFMRTERVMKNLNTEEFKKRFRFDLSESVEHIGRAVAALSADSDVLGRPPDRQAGARPQTIPFNSGQRASVGSTESASDQWTPACRTEAWHHG